MTTMGVDEVRHSDVIDDYGELRRISRVERREGWAWPIACDDTGWAIALGRGLVCRMATPTDHRRRAELVPNAGSEEPIAAGNKLKARFRWLVSMAAAPTATRCRRGVRDGGRASGHLVS
jgi:hypothetical protein